MSRTDTPDAVLAGALRRLAQSGALLVDQRSDPPLRALLGGLLATAAEGDFAVARIRLAGIDLSGSELGGIRRCRILLGRLDADTAADAGHELTADPLRAENLRRLKWFVESGRVRIRAAGVQEWSPDFSVLRRSATPAEDPLAAVTVIGAHYFARASPMAGPAFTSLVAGADAGARAEQRFNELFRKAYDVTGVVRELLADLLAGAG